MQDKIKIFKNGEYLWVTEKELSKIVDFEESLIQEV